MVRRKRSRRRKRRRLVKAFLVYFLNLAGANSGTTCFRSEKEFMASEDTCPAQ